MACWSQGNVESLFPRRSLAAPLGLFPLHGKSSLCCTMKDVDYIRHFIRQDRPGHFLQICDTRVQKQGFECSGGKKEKKNSIQFVLHSAINSVKWLFFKIEKKKTTEKLWLWKGCHNKLGCIRMNPLPLANESDSIYHLNWLDWERVWGHQWQ